VAGSANTCCDKSPSHTMAKCARRRPLCGERAVSISGRDRGALAAVMAVNSRRHFASHAGKGHPER
jgi:hypothetical protein